MSSATSKNLPKNGSTSVAIVLATAERDKQKEAFPVKNMGQKIGNYGKLYFFFKFL